MTFNYGTVLTIHALILPNVGGEILKLPEIFSVYRSNFEPEQHKNNCPTR